MSEELHNGSLERGGARWSLYFKCVHVCVCVGGGGTTGTCDIQIILVKPFKSSTPGGAGMGHTPWLASVR